MFRHLGWAALCVAALTGCQGKIESMGSGGAGTGAGAGGSSGAGGGTAACDAVCQMQAVPPGCLPTSDYFDQWAWPNVFTTCVACHKSGGAADGTRLMLREATAPNYLAFNYAAVTEAAKIQEAGEPLILRKPTLQTPHQGGQQIQAGTKPHAVLLELLKQLKAPVTCGPVIPTPTPVTQGVVLMSPYETFRKATLTLAGRVPTPAEITAVDAEGMPGVERLLLEVMKEDNFYDKVREIFADVLLTDGFLAANSDGHSDLVRIDDNFPATVGAWDGLADWQFATTKNGVRTNDALTREPLEYFVHVTKKDGSLAEVLTAKYRLVNPWSARFMHVPFKGVAWDQINLATADPKEFVESPMPLIHERGGAPGEYAGVLTTTAFLARYPNTPTNFNRKRARFTYKYFLNYDIMKSAPRIDASAIEAATNPTRNAAVCTGCHAKIDPFAGALASWTECGYADTFKYWTWAEKANVCNDRGWQPDAKAFPPGIGDGLSRPLTDAERTRGAEVLAAHIVLQDGFAEALASQVMVGVLDQPRLEEPQDPAQPGYANLLAAVDYERLEFKRFVAAFKANNLRLKPLVLAVVTSPLFRAKSADVAGRLELTGQGGGALSTPEDIDRRLESLFGVPWIHILPRDTFDLVGERYLRRADDLKVPYGGMTGHKDGVKVRQRRVSSVSARINERMALMVSCTATPRDFDLPAAQRRLFPLVEKTALPSGNAAAADQAAILANLQYLHARFWGERYAVDAPEIVASYQLLSQARADGKAAIAAGQATAALNRPCANDVDLVTGQARVPAGTVNDPEFVVRGWQTVIAYLLMDYKFMMEN